MNRKKKSFNKNPKFGTNKPTLKDFAILIVVIIVVAYLVLTYLN